MPQLATLSSCGWWKNGSRFIWRHPFTNHNSSTTYHMDKLWYLLCYFMWYKIYFLSSDHYNNQFLVPKRWILISYLQLIMKICTFITDLLQRKTSVALLVVLVHNAWQHHLLLRTLRKMNENAVPSVPIISGAHYGIANQRSVSSLLHRPRHF